MRALVSLVVLMAVAVSPTRLPAQSEASWLRYPAISPDGQTIVFTYQGDLYRVAATGGAATPLTTHTAHDFMPVWSRDGRQIAFASDRHGNFDVFVMPATGGEARRLTFHSAPEYPYAFSHDNRQVLFGAARMDVAPNRLYPIGSQPELYQVAATGGRPEQILTSPAEEVSVSRDGRYLLYQDHKGRENPWRKHHTSAITRDIWVYDRQAGTHRQVTTFNGEDRSPVLAADDRSFFWLSEQSGSFNVHQMNLDGTGARQLTSFRGAPVRFLSRADNGTLAFSQDGSLYTLAPGAQPRRLSVTIAADAKANNQRVVPVSGGVGQLAVSPNGKEVAFIFRGDVFVTSVEGTTTKRITTTPDAETGVSFSPDGRALLYSSPRGGRWAVYEARRTRAAEPYFYAATLITETPVIANTQQNSGARYSPDGKEIAYLENRTTLRVFNTESRQTRTLLTDQHIWGTGPTQHFEWSPDGKWILFNYSVPGVAPGEAGLVRADGTGTPINLTQSGFGDRGATWILGGQAMLWYSNRDGLKAVAQTGGSQTDAYAMFFTQAAYDRFRLSREEFALVKEAEDSAAKAKPDSVKAAQAAGVTLELEGAEDRTVRLTTHSSSMSDALLSKDGETLYYLARFERGLNLWSTTLRTRETRQVLALNANSASMTWDKDQKAIFLLANGQLSKVDPATARRENIGISAEMTADTQAERAAAFDHVYRKVRDTYYTRDYHGVDWAALRPVYEKHLPHIGNNHEFAELLAEMLGELNVSHSGATYSSSTPTDDATAALGVILDQAWRGAGVRIAEVIKGGPLDKAGMNVAAGTIIESVDGEVIAPERDLAEFLNRKADRNVLLGLLEGSARRELVVRPISLGQENQLLYTRWVDRNRAEVERLSNGRLGYVHIPGMNDGAYRTTIEEVMGRHITKEGIVVDTRFNGGGDLVADLAMFLSGKAFFDYTTDTRSSGFEPNFRWTKPSVSLVNEANYSDGHCYAWAYKELGIGPLIGMPVPGTCTFAGWESIEGGVRWGAPGLGVKDATTGRYLENWQTEPDIRVMMEFVPASRGQDQQLEAAVRELLRLVGG